MCLHSFSPGWWFSHPSEKYEFVNWDDEIPNTSGKVKSMATKPPTSQKLFLCFLQAFRGFIVQPRMVSSTFATCCRPAEST